MKGERRPTPRNSDAEGQAAAHAEKPAAAVSLPEPAAPAGHGPSPTAAPSTAITASPPISIQPGLRQYNPPALQQPPQPWLSSGAQNPSLPLRLSEVREPPTAGYNPASPLEPIPPQGAGPHFTIGAAGRIAVAPPSELDAAGNDLGHLRQLLPLVRNAAVDLAAALNPNQFTVLSRNLADYRAAIEGDTPEIAWGLVFGLGVRLANAADAAQRHIEERLLPALEDPAQEALQSLTVLHGSLIMATAEGRELEEQADRLQMTREQQTAFGPMR
jgi:hypothetical protein